MPRNLYHIAQVLNPVGRGAMGAYHATLPSIIKANPGGLPYVVATEYICAEVGHAIGLPIPPVGIFRDVNGVLWFGCLNFNRDNIDLPNADGARCVRELPFVSAGIAVFDLFIHNDDRVDHNLSVDFRSTPPRIDIFDHSNCLIGRTLQGGINARLEGLEAGLPDVGRHILISHLSERPHIEAWSKRIEALPDHLLDDSCALTETCGLSHEEAVAVSDYLKRRRDSFISIIFANMSVFPKVV